MIQVLSVIGALVLGLAIYDVLKFYFLKWVGKILKDDPDSEVVIKVSVDSSEAIKELTKLQGEISKIKIN